MTEFLREWTMTLCGIIVFGSLCEMLLPNSVYKKYINLAIGLILCVALISPFIKGRYDMSFDIPTVETAYSDVDEGQDILTVYTKKLCESIEGELSKSTDLKLDVKCQVSDNADSFGRIENIYILADANEGKKLDDALAENIKLMYQADSIEVKYIK